MRFFKSTWSLDIVLIAISLTAFYFLWTGSYPLFTPDEGRYSEVAREMVMAHNYITPNLNGVAFLDKPILYYWLQASTIKLFGLKELSLRLWPVSFGIFCCLMTYLSGRYLFNRRTGLLAAFILAANPLFFGSSHYANLDLEVAVMIASSLFFFLLGAAPKNNVIGPKEKFFLLLGYFFASLSFLTKGLIGVVFPAMILGAWIILLKNWRLLTKLQLLGGVLIFITLVAPWYTLAQKANPQFFHFFFITQQFARFLTIADFNNQSARGFYVPIVMLGFLPWTLFLAQAYIEQARLVYQNKSQHRALLFLLLWPTLIFIFFSIPKSKTIGYILPIFPALALLTGHYLSEHWHHLKIKGIYFGLILFVPTGGLAAVISLIVPHIDFVRVPSPLVPYLTLTAVILTVASLLNYYFLRTQQLKKALYTIFTVAPLLLLVLVKSAPVINYKSIKPIATHLNTILKPTDEVVTYYKYFQDLPIYIQRRITVVADWHSETIPHYDNWQRELWFGMPYKDTSAWLIEEPAFWLRWQGHHHIYAILYTNYYPDFLYKAKNKAYEIAIDHDFVLVSNQPLSSLKIASPLAREAKIFKTPP